MDQELKQRLIGAVVVTALAAIFIPMLFDDPIDDKSQQVSELAIPPTPPVATDEAAVGKVPADSSQVLNADNPEEGYVEGSEEEPMQPVEGDDTDESGFEDDIQPAVKPKQPVPNSKPKRSAEDSTVANDVVDAETEAKVYAEVEKLRPKAESKRESASKPVAEDVHSSAKNAEAVRTKVTPKPAVIVKPVSTEKPQATKKIVTDAETVKPTVPKRWTIQVGSFGKKENALSLSESLRKDGFPVSMDTIQGEKGTLYRLKIGPELDGKRAAEMKARLDKQHVKSMLIAE